MSAGATDCVRKMVGEAISDERQLDGSRHLEIEAKDSEHGGYLLLRLVVSREGDLVEGELEVESAGEAWSGALTEHGRVEFETPLRVRARFGEVEGSGEGLGLDVVEGDEPGLFRVELRGD